MSPREIEKWAKGQAYWARRRERAASARWFVVFAAWLGDYEPPKELAECNRLAAEHRGEARAYEQVESKLRARRLARGGR